MPKTPKPASPEAPEDLTNDPKEDKGRGEKGSYYYDDAHGYQPYNPDLDNDDEECDDEKKPGQRPDPDQRLISE